MSKEKVSQLAKELEVKRETAKRLVEGGYKTIEAVAIAHPVGLSTDTKLPDELAEHIVLKAREMMQQFKPKTAADLLEEERTRIRITTGSRELDSILDGGIWTGEITEFAGPFSTGKTQLCFQLAITTQLDLDRGGAEGKVFYIDSEGTFSAKRVMEISLAFELDPMEALRNILVARALDASHQMELVKEVANIAREQNIKLVIIDSFASHFRAEYMGKERIIDRQQKIMFHAAQLSNLATVLDLGVVVTNQIVANIDDFNIGSTQPALGLAWSHRPQQRILLRRSRGQSRVARLFDSPRSPEYEAVFYISRDGISDQPQP